MDKEKQEELALFKGLVALSDSSFPKICASCDKIYESEQEFINETQRIRGLSGLKESEDDDGTPIVELFRNCHCGSTLLDFFQERRVYSNKRDLFDDLVILLKKKGYEDSDAKNELRRVINDEPSQLIRDLGIDISRLRPE